MKAVTDFDKAIELDPYFVDAYYHRGGTFKLMREYGKAILDCEKAIRLDPKHDASNWLLAWMLATCQEAKFRDGKKAVAVATKGCELSNWKDAYDLDCLAAGYAETGKFEAAVRWQTKANAFWSGDADKADGDIRLRLYRDRKPYHEPES